MSSSQEQSTNSNNEQLPTTRSDHQVLPTTQYNDYEYDPSLNLNNNSNADTQSSHLYFDSTEQQYYLDNYNDEEVDDDDDIPHELEAELYGTIERMSNAQVFDDDNEGEDDVQNAFVNYENDGEVDYPDDVQNAFVTYENEQNEMFEQMRECMRFMSHEYAMAEMPESFIRSTQESRLNPDAHEFLPSWAAPSTSKEMESIVTSWIPFEVKKQAEEKDDS